MKRIVLLVLIINGCFFNTTIAQLATSIEWEKSLGGSGKETLVSVIQTFDGGYLVTGYSNSNDGDVSGNHGSYDAWLVKLDEGGNMVWEKCLGGSNDDWALSSVQSADGGYYVSCLTNSSDGDVSGNHGGYDWWILKIDSIGNIILKKCFGGTQDDRVDNIHELTDGSLIVSGSTKSSDGDVLSNHGQADYWILKLDSNLNIIWQSSRGGGANDYETFSQVSSDGGVICVGYTYSNDGEVSGAHVGTGPDCWVAKLDSDGNLQWQKALGGTTYDFGACAQQNNDGSFIITAFSDGTDGDLTANHGSYDYWIVKLSNSGNIIWQKSLGGSDFDMAYSSFETTNGGSIVVGYSQSNDGDVTGNHGGCDYWIVNLDSAENITSEMSYGGSNCDVAYCIQKTTAGFVVAGTSQSNDGDVSGNHGDIDYWIVKFSGDSWETCSASFTPVIDSLIPHHYWLISDVNGVPPISYLWSWGDGTTDTAAYPSHTYDSEGFYNICLTIVDSTGCTDSSCVGYDLQKSEQMNLIITVDVVDSIPDIATGILNENILQSVSVYPNPASGNVFANYSLSAPATVTIELYDVLGNKLQQINYDEQEGTHRSRIDLQNLPGGIYSLQIRAGNQIASQKIVVVN